ncbi:hypothetical protein DSECCO2_482150 [anaerobic digester metagenome]
MQIPGHVVLDEGNASGRQEPDDLALGLVGRQGTVGVVEIGREDAGPDVEAPQGPLHVGGLHPVARVRWDLDGAHALVLQELLEAEVGRGLNEHVVAGPDQAAHGHVQGLQGAAGDDDLLGPHVQAGLGRAQGQLASQLRTALHGQVGHLPLGVLPRQPRRDLGKLAVRQQILGRAVDAQGQKLPVAHGLEHRGDELAAVDGVRPQHGPRRPRRGGKLLHVAAHEEPGPRPRLDDPLALQLGVGLQHRAYRHPAAQADMAQGRQPRPRPKGARSDLLHEILFDLTVSEIFHGNVLVSDAGSHRLLSPMWLRCSAVSESAEAARDTTKGMDSRLRGNDVQQGAQVVFSCSGAGLRH